MILKTAIIKPFEVLAGMEYPDMDHVRQEASAGQATSHEVEMSVNHARHKFMENLVSLQGIRKMIG